MTKKDQAIKNLSNFIEPSLAKNDIELILSIFKEVYYKCLFKLIDCQGERWNIDNVIYCLNKQREFRYAELAYNADYISKRHSISKEEALLKINEFKKNKSTSLQSFISRCGESVGLEKFKKFQETSKSPLIKLKENLIREYGLDSGLELYKKEVKSRSVFSPYFYIKKLGVSYEEAYEMAKKRNIENAGVSIIYYKNKGYSDDEISAILEKINLKKGNNLRNRKQLIEKYGDGWIDVYKLYCNKYRSKMEQAGNWIKLEDLEKFKKYKILCWFWTRQTLISESIEDIEKRSIEYHLDHMFSLKDGFVNDVSPEIIGSKFNLRIIKQFENCSKGCKSSISIETLLNLYYENKKD